MVKLLKKHIAMSLVVICLVGVFAGCIGKDTKNETNETNKIEKITTEEVTTEAPTEEPTTEYKYKGKNYVFRANSLFGKYFANRVLNPGDKIVINDVCEQKLSPTSRGRKVEDIIRMIYTDFYPKLALEFCNKYSIPGVGNYEFTYEENFVIEYKGDKPIMFEVVKEEKRKVYLDIYLLD